MGARNLILGYIVYFYKLLWPPIAVHFPELVPYLGTHPVLETAALFLIIYLSTSATVRLLTSLKDYLLKSFARAKLLVQRIRTSNFQNTFFY